MAILYILILGTVIWGICHAVRRLLAGSPEERREEEAYRKLMDQLKEEASYYAGRPVSEEEILQIGREYNRRRNRNNQY